MSEKLLSDLFDLKVPKPLPCNVYSQPKLQQCSNDHTNNLNLVNGQNEKFSLFPHPDIDFLHQHSPKTVKRNTNPNRCSVKIKDQQLNTFQKHPLSHLLLRDPHCKLHISDSKTHPFERHLLASHNTNVA